MRALPSETRIDLKTKRKKKEERKPDRKMTDPRFKLHSTPSGLQSAQGSWNKRKY